jgi:hypothetical protein
MAIDTWGDKPKSQVDNSTVDEEIALLIQAHDDDADAHLDATQSLQSHKASEIIDHLARSIISDKLQEWIDLTAVGSFKRSDFHVVFIFESLDPLDITNCGFGNGYVSVNSGGLRVMTGNTIDGWFQSRRYLTLSPMINDWAKKRSFQTKVFVAYNVNCIFRVINGDYEENLIGFEFRNDSLYGIACSIEDGIVGEVLLFNSLPSFYLLLEVVFYPGDRVDFYVDDVLVGVLTEHLPTGSDNAVTICNVYAKTLNADYKHIDLSYFDFWLDK